MKYTTWNTRGIAHKEKLDNILYKKDIKLVIINETKEMKRDYRNRGFYYNTQWSKQEYISTSRS
jgi:hypothetical protein